jgi:hypothetical protein
MILEIEAVRVYRKRGRFNQQINRARIHGAFHLAETKRKEPDSEKAHLLTSAVMGHGTPSLLSVTLHPLDLESSLLNVSKQEH